MIFINSSSPVPGHPALGPATQPGARAAVEHLIDTHGFSSVALIIGESGEVVPEPRERGWAEAFRSHDLQPGPIVRTRYSRRGGYEAAAEILTWSTRPTAIFVASDQQASGALSAFWRAGLRCPEDIAIVSFDGTSESEYCWPPLTVVRQPIQEMAEAAVDAVLGLSSPPLTYRPVRHRVGDPRSRAAAAHRHGPTALDEPIHLLRRSVVTATVDLYVSLHEAGVSVVLDLTAGHLPAVVHWGADLGPVSPEDAAKIALSGVDGIAPNLVDDPVRVALLPEHWTGWVGRPGISGARAVGQGWSPKFRTTALRVAGEPVSSPPGRLLHVDGPVLLEVDAVDPVAELELTLRFELLVGGLIRSQVELRNLGDAYSVHDCVLAFPVPSVASEILDFAGRWGKERIPQRRPLNVGTHLREGRKGRTGPDAATVLHLGVPGFSFADGEVWAVHTGWSGNHTHYAERLSTGEQVIGGGELLLPDEVVLASGRVATRLRGSTRAYGVGLDAVARRFHRYLRSRDQHPSVDRPVTINVWEAVYFDHDLDQLVALAEAAAELGVERFVLDDGWFGVPPQRPGRPRRLDRLDGGLAERTAPTGRQGAPSSGWSSGCGSSPR